MLVLGEGTIPQGRLFILVNVSDWGNKRSQIFCSNCQSFNKLTRKTSVSCVRLNRDEPG